MLSTRHSQVVLQTGHSQVILYTVQVNVLLYSEYNQVIGALDTVSLCCTLDRAR